MPLTAYIGSRVQIATQLAGLLVALIGFGLGISSLIASGRSDAGIAACQRQKDTYADSLMFRATVKTALLEAATTPAEKKLIRDGITKPTLPTC